MLTIADDYLVRGEGVDLAVRDYGGAGPAVLCLHGGTANAAVWDPVARELGGEVRLVAFDERGHGRSSSTDDWSLRARVADIHDVIREVGIDRPVLVGHGSGADLALVFASTNLACPGVVAVEAPAVIGEAPARDDGGRDWEEEAERWRRYGTFGWKGTVLELEQRLGRMPVPRGVDREDLVTVARRNHVRIDDGRLLRRPTVDDLVAFAAARDAEPVTAATVALVACPVLFVYARRHRFVAHGGAVEAAVSNQPRRRVEWLEGGHQLTLEQPAALAALIVEQVGRAVTRF